MKASVLEAPDASLQPGKPSRRRRWLMGLGAAALAGGIVFGTTTPASALDNVSCTSYDYLWMQSNRTTCWRNSGSQWVSLSNVYGVNPGGWSGYFNYYHWGGWDYYDFVDNKPYRLSDTVYVYFLHIYRYYGHD